MSISFFGLDIAMTGMNANQKALEVTGHNVSNLGTEGYSRQGAILVGAPTKSYGNWRVEMGVNVQQIRQIRDLFQDNLVRTDSNSLGYWETRYKAVEDLQAIVGEPMKEGLQTAMNQFWDSWQELSKAPESLTIRSLVRQRADSLVNYVNHVGSQINKLQSDLNAEVKRRVEEVNEITRKVADLNVKIASAEAAGNLPNDFYDQRNTLVDRLSKLVTVDTNTATDGQMDLMVGGYFLVSKGEQTNLEARSNGLQSNFYTPMLEGYDIEVKVGQGIIKGLLEGRGEVSGAAGSVDNGSPNTDTEITFMVDTSSTSGAYLANLQGNIDQLVNETTARGLTPTYRLVTFDGAGTLHNDQYPDAASFKTALLALVPTGLTSFDFGTALAGYTASLPVPSTTNRIAQLFTGESMGGNDPMTPVTPATANSWIAQLTAGNISFSVAQDNSTVVLDAGELAWSEITKSTNGNTYDFNALGFPGMLKQMGTDISTEVNTRMATDVESTNIVSGVRRQLNAMLNIMMREVNYLHKSGTTLDGMAGADFFQQMTTTRPLEMGNIKLNNNLTDVNALVAGTTNANGDNSVALTIAGLRNKMLMTGRTKSLSLDTYYQNVILQIGNTGYDAESIMNNQKSLVDQADALRQSIMGVSLDEEMGNMIKFKYAYNAASKNIKVIDEMIDTMVNRMGAGRG